MVTVIVSVSDVTASPGRAGHGSLMQPLNSATAVDLSSLPISWYLLVNKRHGLLRFHHHADDCLSPPGLLVVLTI